MADLGVRASMSDDLAVRARVAPVLSRLALDILGEDILDDTAPLADRVYQGSRRALAARVLDDPHKMAVPGQWAAVNWRGSALADTYATGGSAAVTDNDLEYVLLAVWDSLAAMPD